MIHISHIRQSLIVTRLVVLALLMFFGIHVIADDFTVFSVTGRVKVGSNLVKKGMTLKTTNEVVIGDNSKLILIDEKNNKIVTVNGSVEGKIYEVITSSKSSLKSVSGKYITYMKQKMSGAAKDKDYMQSAGTSYRETDSIANEALKKLQRIDRKQDNDSIKK